MTILVSQSGKHWMIRHPTSGARNVLIMTSLFLGLWIGTPYKGELLSALVAKDYERPINSIDELIVSQRLLLVADGTVIQGVLDNHPRADVRKLMKDKGQRFPFRGLFPEYVIKS